VELEEYYQHIKDCQDKIVAAAVDFLGDRPNTPVSNRDKAGTYTKSVDYIKELYEFHCDPWVLGFMASFHEMLGKTPRLKSITDVGCVFGFSGLPLAHAGYHVTFHDFEGYGLEFIKWYIAREKLDAEVIPYGGVVHRQDVVLAIDVLEHTGNHLGAIKWFKELGDVVALSYPVRVPWKPPFEPSGLDEWIDDELMCMALRFRYQVYNSSLQHGWRTVVYS
jgi:hypothetical protein